MTHFSRTTPKELKKRYLNILKKCLFVNMMSFGMVSLSTPCFSSFDDITRILSPGAALLATEEFLGVTSYPEYSGTLPTYGGGLNGSATIDLGAHFSNLNAYYGGALYTSDMTFNTSEEYPGRGHNFYNNTAVYQGGAIYNNGNLTFNKETVSFIGNKASSGGALYNKGTALFNTHTNFSGNLLSYEGGAIYNESQGIITFNSTFTFLNNDAMSGSDIYNIGTVNFSNNSGNGLLSQGIHNDGVINKTGNGILFLGDDMVNSGLGKFVQIAGITIANSNNLNFAENYVIEGGELKTHGAKIGYNALVGGEGSLTHYGTSIDATNIKGISFQNENANLTIHFDTYTKSVQNSEKKLLSSNTSDIFSVSALEDGDKAVFVLENDLKNEKGNILSFDNINLYLKKGLGQSGAIYLFNNSILDSSTGLNITNQVKANNLTIADGVGRVSFDDIEILKGSIFDIRNNLVTANNMHMLEDSILSVTLNNREDFGTLTSNNFTTETGTAIRFILGADFKSGIYNIFDLTGYQDLMVNVTDNIFYDIEDMGNGQFKFSLKDDYKDKETEPMPIEPLKPNEPIEPEEPNIPKEPDTPNVPLGPEKIYSDLSSSVGGVLYNEKTITYLTNVKFLRNSALGTYAFAGAIYNDGNITFNGWATFSQNKATNYGGAIHNYGTIIFNDYTIFEDNQLVPDSASSTPSGGAIDSRLGSITFNKGFEFSGNKAVRGADIYNVNTSVVNFAHAEGEIGTLDGGIYNRGVINKSGEGILVLGDSMVNDADGSFVQTAGLTIANSDNLKISKTHTINGGELKTHGAEIKHVAVVGKDTTTGSVGAATHYTTLKEMDVNKITVSSATFASEGLGATIGFGSYTKSEQEVEKALVSDRDAEHVARLFSLTELSDELTRFKVTEALDKESGNILTFNNAIVEIDETLAETGTGATYRFNNTRLDMLDKSTITNKVQSHNMTLGEGITEIRFKDLEILSGSEFDIRNIHVTAEKMLMQSNSTLSVTINSAEDLGKLTSADFTVENGTGVRFVLGADFTEGTYDIFDATGYEPLALSIKDNILYDIKDAGEGRYIFTLKEELKDPKEEPDTPVVPDEPDTPVVPEEPDTPVVPDEPDTPVVPEEPDTPVVPDEPDTPVVPDEPDTPVVPEQPKPTQQTEILKSEEVTVVKALLKGSSQTDTVFNKIQSEILETLQSGNPSTVAKAKKALKALGGSDQAIAQSVSIGQFNKLQGVVTKMMHNPSGRVGHSGGDETPRAMMYIKGLYDKAESTLGEGFKSTSKGAVLGVQSKVRDDLTVGIGYSTTNTEATEDLRETIANTNTVFVSALYQPNKSWVSAVVSYSRGQYEEEKQVLSTVSEADYNVDSWGVQVMAGYNIELEHVVISPEVGLRYIDVRQESYTDTLGTNVGNNTSSTATALIGVRGMIDGGWIRPTLGITLGYDFKQDDVSAVNTLANEATYTIKGEKTERLSTSLSLGVEADITERTSLGVEYAATLKRDYTEHSGTIKLEHKF